MFYFATESGDHVIKILICEWSVFNVVVGFWRQKFCNWREKLAPETDASFWRQFLAPVSGACVISISADFKVE